MTNTNQHAYSPLDHPRAIRMLILGRGAKDDPISCMLFHTELNDRMGRYEALSYEWGQPGNNEPSILMDGEPLLVRSNLWAALGQIRSMDEDIFLWVDALCIDQSNIRERNHQVQLMKEIYSKADCVIAWLGPARENSDLAMAALANPADLKMRIEKKPLKPTEAEAIVALCSRSYWRRVWIMQEIFLARRYVAWCGSKSITEKQITEAMFIMRSRNAHLEPLNGEFSRRIVESPAHEQQFAKELRGVATLGRWVRICQLHNFEATEPRDLVYAVLGISTDCQNGEIVPDYEKPVLDVYLDALDMCKSANGVSESSGHRFASRLATRMGLNPEDSEMKRHIESYGAGMGSGRRWSIPGPWNMRF